MTLEEYNALAAIPPPMADAYCLGTLHSGGCVAQMSWTGVPSTTDKNPFVVRATLVTPDAIGFVFYGFQHAKVPFQPGASCVQSPLYRTPAQISGGTAACGGTISFDFNPLIQSGVHPQMVVGAQVFCQVRFRDTRVPTLFANALSTDLSNALRFTIQP